MRKIWFTVIGLAAIFGEGVVLIHDVMQSENLVAEKVVNLSEEELLADNLVIESDTITNDSIEKETIAVEVLEEPTELVSEETKEEVASVELASAKVSYYADRFHGRLTASGERFDMNALTAAHKTLPFGTKVRVINEANNKEVIVTINDRGPYVHGREFDLSKGAFNAIGNTRSGIMKIKYEILD